jgi:ATP-dependent Clp protease protease subunit
MMSLPPELEATLFGRRVVFLRGRLDDAVANSAIGQLVLLARTAPERTVELYLDSPGGSLGAAMGLYDVIRTLGSPVSTTCIGTAGGAAVLILASGAVGRRYALPHARVHLMQEPISAPTDRFSDVASQANEATRLFARWQEALVRHGAHSAARLDQDLTAGRWLSAAEARDYGLVDGIIPGRGAAVGALHT